MEATKLKLQDKIEGPSPCDTCMFYPYEKKSVEPNGEELTDLVPQDECPMSVDVTAEDDLDPLSISVWEKITRMTGCTCWRQKK